MVKGLEVRAAVDCGCDFKTRTANEMIRSLVGSEMCKRDSPIIRGTNKVTGSILEMQKSKLFEKDEQNA
ncbi:hypothetical protein AWZ97_19370 [Shigella sonnei]|nr:hypothetical protein AWZ97_19370 [Shigella sonnei]